MNVCQHVQIRWKPDHIRYLHENIGKKSIQEIGEHIGKTPEQIRNRLNYEKRK